MFKEPELEWEKTVFNWPLISSPIPTLTLCSMYVYFVKFLGPRLMKDKEAFRIKYLILIYNIATVLLNLYIFLSLGAYGWFTKYKFTCQEFDFSPNGHRVNWICYLYFLSKFYDFADTIFFVVTKKNTHITYLHVIHHSLMPIYCWMGMRLGPNGHGTFAPLLNSFIHVIMYSYYALALLGPSVRPYLWWKKYLTQMQLLQFFLIFLHSSQLYFQYPFPCRYPLFAFYIYAVLTAMFTALFLNFYIQSYLSPRKGKSMFNAIAVAAADTRNGSLKHDMNSNVVTSVANGKKIH